MKHIREHSNGAHDELNVPLEKAVVEALGNKTIVLVGIMGCGKSTVGRRLAQRLDLNFLDADTEIERAANMTVSEIFAEHGEPYFRSGEERVIARLLQEGPQVLATGGGAVMSEATRKEIAENGISIWLKAEFNTVMARVRRRSTRPLLQNPDPEGTMRALMEKRHPVYALAELTVLSREVPHEAVVDEIMEALSQHLLGADAAR
ncbi:shikimate kinase [Roseibium sp. TrichSKD4]|uniref:shikimate kinase n=1 Tax=Roseibium sp. TrichSKD4 TaxID=744980 RepID=UPI0001E5647F|nr:shikimate kinase [Roseibium sp. TrichSKD4]EFO33362.1 shikimate kinase [Roseibium sp. TrichSKD4]